MANINDIVRILDAILYEIELHDSSLPFLDIETEKFCSLNISREDVCKIIKKLTDHKHISFMYSRNAICQLRYAILDKDNNHILSFTFDKISL